MIVENRLPEAMEQSAKFPTTSWTLVVSARQGSDVDAAEALAALCERYWYPIYAFTRRRGHSSPEAQDLTQEFFARLLEKRTIEHADPAKGRFRTYLLSSFEYFLADESERRLALKRGGGVPHLSLPIGRGEERYQDEPRSQETPERIFERRWALTLIERVLALLRDGFVREGRGDHFDRLKPFLLGVDAAPYAALAAQLDASEGALRIAVHRLRRRYRNLFRAEIADTVASEDEIDGEIRYLLQVLSAG
jgi:RNA polymerase sigma factor (sigma-70 family)